MLTIIFIIITGLAAIGGLWLLTKKFTESEKSKYESLKGRIEYLQEDFTDQGGFEHRSSSKNEFINFISYYLPAPSPEKMDLLNKAGLRHKGAYQAKQIEQVAVTTLMVVAGTIFGVLLEEPLAIALLGPVLGFLAYSRFWQGLKKDIAKRSLFIDKTLPDIIDLFANACAAGTSFDIAADFILGQLPETRIAKPIKEDFLAWQQDIRFGVERPEAWIRLHQRSESKNMRYFCNLIDQSEKTGGSIGEALLKMADFFRERRRQQVEAEIAQLRGKLVLLTIVFIVLPILIYMIVPIGIQVVGQFKGVFAGG